MLLSGVFFHFFDHPTEPCVEVQIYHAAICCMDADTEIAEQVPVFCYLVRITAQAGEAMNQEYINLPILCRRIEIQQTRTVHSEAAPYIAGSTNDFKIMLFS